MLDPPGALGHQVLQVSQGPRGSLEAQDALGPLVWTGRRDKQGLLVSQGRRGQVGLLEPRELWGSLVQREQQGLLDH